MLESSNILIAISGGLDSVVLAHLCHKLKLNIAFAHCNFQLRGDESDADESYVLKLAEELKIQCFVEPFDTEDYAKNNKLSTQMAARELRYYWFKELAEQFEFDYVLTAHHADDNLETFLINFSRGTGLEGLTGIPEINENIVRPLLSFSRHDIEAYATNNKLSWREDSSNSSTKYLRNKLRHDVIPVLKEINPKLLQNFSKTQAHLQDSKTIIDDRIDEISDAVIKHISTNEIQFDISKIEALNNPKVYLFQLLKDYNFTEWDNVYNLLKAQSGKQVLSHSHRLVKDRECLLLSKINESTPQNINIAEDVKQIKTPFGVLKFEEADEVLETKNNQIFVDKHNMEFPLSVRKWQEGDYFYPFGMNGKKKLSKYFKDEKLSVLEKENVWLLCSGRTIIWVINRRLDNRFKVTENTSQILKIELLK